VEFKAIRRVVVGHDPHGKAVAVFDGAVAPTQRTPGGNAVANLWVTGESPANLDGTADKAQTKVGVFPPTPNTAPPTHVEHEKILTAMGIDPATQGYARHRNTHRTKSVDYAIVLDGEIDMLMDETEVHLKAGDVLVQQGTNHAWVNNSGKVCRIAFVLIDAKAPTAWRRDWKP
jgi:mannose-6-phosphate isomerase-like protein (cupin superfamily)